MKEESFNDSGVHLSPTVNILIDPFQFNNTFKKFTKNASGLMREKQENIKSSQLMERGYRLWQQGVKRMCISK